VAAAGNPPPPRTAEAGIFEAEGRVYALNEMTEAASLGTPIGPIWADTAMSLRPLIDRGFELCR
jgi:hypothetical protein